MSQFPTISPVANIYPDDTTGEGPPTTDTDGDGIPDVHETIFEEWVNFSAVDGRLVSMEGMDKEDASDANFDTCLLYTSPSPRDATLSRMPSSA